MKKITRNYVESYDYKVTLTCMQKPEIFEDFNEGKI